MPSQSPIQRMLHTLSKHPYLCVIVSCVLLMPFGLCQKSNLGIGSLFYVGVVCAVLGGIFVFAVDIGKSAAQKVGAFIGIIAYGAMSLLLLQSTEYSSAVMLVMPLLLLTVAAIWLYLNKALSSRSLVMLMIAAGILLRFIYVLYTASDMRQHDVGYWNWTWGHANYIEYWYHNGLTLPDFDVRTIWQYYHPPLHHWIMALLLRFYAMIGIDYDLATQGLQFLPLLYSSLIMVVCYRIFRFVKLKGAPLVVAMMFLCFHPTFVLMAGFFNNDILSVLFMLSAMLWALRWYRAPRWKNILPIALCVGLGMMTKLSAWMVAPAIAVIFVYILVKNIRRPWGYLAQFLGFGAICAPLALWWQVRNLILFDVPLTYVPYLGEQNNQYLGNMSVLHRLFFFGDGQLSYVFDAFTDYGAPYNEFNPHLGLIKTALFEEGHNGLSTVNFPQLSAIGPMLFWIAVPLFLLMFALFFLSMFSKKTRLDGIVRVFFVAVYVVILVAYYIFCFQFPFTCTMNIRYAVPLIPLSAMGMGLMLQATRSKTLRAVAYTLTGAFCSASAVMFTMVG